jgi:OOP family OmpA-OmpF porin
MKTAFPTALLVGLLICLPSVVSSGVVPLKKHDYVPKYHNIIFIMDVSDSMMSGYPKSFDLTRLFVATRAFKLFNRVMPPVPHWQYDLNAALITFGDCEHPQLAGVLGPWSRAKYMSVTSGSIRHYKFYPWRTAGFQEALQLAGSIAAGAVGRTAIVVFTDGGSAGEGPQLTATALKDKFGDKVCVYGVYFGNMEVSWRNLYEVCKLTGGYARAWDEVNAPKIMKSFAWDVLVNEIMFPYPEIFFKHKSAELLPSEALKLESVANFMHAIPQYELQIDGHSDFLGSMKGNYGLALARAKNVKQSLVKMYKVDPQRIAIRSWGEELPRYDNHNTEQRHKNREANLYLTLPLRNVPYNEKNLSTFGHKAVGDLHITRERNSDTEWAWPAERDLTKLRRRIRK